MENLLQVRTIVDDALDEFQTGNTHNQTKRRLALLYRLRPHCEQYFEDFSSYVEKLAYYDPDFSFYSDLRNYLQNSFGADPWDVLYSHLNKRGYTKETITSMPFSPPEKAFISSLPSNRNFLYILTFYLFNPQKTMKFFMENMTVPLSKEDQQILKYFRSLDEELQHRAIAYVKNLAKYEY